MQLSKVKPGATPSIKTPQELVHIRHRITLRQYKYWVLMLKKYREDYEAGVNPSENGFHYIPRKVMSDYLGYELVKKELRADFEALRKESIIYNVLGKDGKAAQRGAGFISEWEISDGWIGYKLPDFLIRCVEQLDLKNKIFQQLNWNVFNSFAGKYEAIMYKLCKDYVGVRRTPYMTLEVFREYMGLSESEYPEYKALKRNVIAGPIQKINESTYADISIELEEEKEGRRVVGLRFLISSRQGQLDLGDSPAFAGARITVPLATQHKYLETVPEDEVALAIERANSYADEQAAKGVDVNLGAIYNTAITQGWGREAKARIAESSKKVAKRKAEAEAQRVAEEKRVATQDIKAVMRDKARVEFAVLDAVEQQVLIDEFAGTIQGFILATFRKSGVTGKLVAPAFADFLIGKLRIAE